MANGPVVKKSVVTQVPEFTDQQISDRFNELPEEPVIQLSGLAIMHALRAVDVGRDLNHASVVVAQAFWQMFLDDGHLHLVKVTKGPYSGFHYCKTSKEWSQSGQSEIVDVLRRPKERISGGLTYLEDGSLSTETLHPDAKNLCGEAGTFLLRNLPDDPELEETAIKVARFGRAAYQLL